MTTKNIVSPVDQEVGLTNCLHRAWTALAHCRVENSDSLSVCRLCHVGSKVLSCYTSLSTEKSRLVLKMKDMQAATGLLSPSKYDRHVLGGGSTALSLLQTCAQTSSQSSTSTRLPSGVVTALTRQGVSLSVPCSLEFGGLSSSHGRRHSNAAHEWAASIANQEATRRQRRPAVTETSAADSSRGVRCQQLWISLSQILMSHIH